MQEQMDKRFKEMQEQMDKRFKGMQEQMDKQFKGIEKRFEEVTSLILLLVKAHEKEIGSEVIDVTLGRKPLEKIAKEIEQDFEEKIKKRRKEEFKEYLRDREILLILKKELEQLDKVA